MSKRANGEGCVYKDRVRGSWIGEYTIITSSGLRKRKRCRAKTQREALKKIEEIKRSIQDGTYIEPNKLTLGQWFNHWLCNYNNHIKPTTLKAYKSIYATHIDPAIGNVPLQRLKPGDIQVFINNIVASPKTVSNVYMVLNCALKKAVDMEYIKSNPCKNITLPKKTKPEKRSFTDEEVKRIFAYMKENEPVYYDFCRIAFFTGLRYAELLGLTWDCFDSEKGYLRVYRQLQLSDGEYTFTSLKNDRPRIVALPEIATNIIKSLDDGLSDFIFHQHSGGSFRYATPRRSFTRCLKRLGIDGRFHDIRHTYATNCLRAGDNPKNVQENLGHSTIEMTMQIYATVTDDMRKESQRTLQNAFKDFE